ncbi:MAG: hypothetical protein SFV81_13630 [Pirellulaceae bacterium]|nr:hypothetical protein [Pirellulaceae bacterium]
MNIKGRIEMTKKNQLYWIAAIALLVGVLVAPARSQAGVITVAQGQIPHPSGTQTINFAHQPLSGTVVGDTNPPNPKLFFDFTANYSKLHANGSGIDTRDMLNTNQPGPGYTTISVTPQLPWIGWTYMDFQADSFLKIAPPTPPNQDLSEFKFTVNYVNSAGVIQSPEVVKLHFPWEGNNGDSQHYYMQADPGYVITSFSLSYSDPNNPTNTIQDMHNWDVTYAPVPGVVPEPASLAIWGSIGLCGLVVGRRRRNKQTK